MARAPYGRVDALPRREHLADWRRLRHPLPAGLLRADPRFGLVQLDFFSFMPVGCVFPDANFYSTLLMSTLIPIGIVAVLGLSGQLLHRAGKTAKGALCFNHVFTLL